VEGENAVIPKNGDNDVKAGVVKESVELNRESG
jgi:translation initiation factor 3 subunit K